jgi:hypothetical protein
VLPSQPSSSSSHYQVIRYVNTGICINIYIYTISIYVYIYIFIYTYVHIHIYINMYRNIHTRIWIQTCVHIDECIHTFYVSSATVFSVRFFSLEDHLKSRKWSKYSESWINVFSSFTWFWVIFQRKRSPSVCVSTLLIVWLCIHIYKYIYSNT